MTQDWLTSMTGQKLLLLSWEVLIHLLYSPDILTMMSIYFHLYKILLMEKFLTLEDCKSYLEQFFPQKDKFREDGILKLLGRWQKVVERNGEYVVQ